MTLRQIALVTEAAIWREGLKDRRSLSQAWWIARLIGWSKVPDLDVFMRERFPKDANGQSTKHVTRALRTWAAERGLKVTRHKKPVRVRD